MIGDTLGPYELTEVIGKGASGVVFKAKDIEKDTVAAVKVLSPQATSNDEQRQRFVRAMKTMLPIRDDRIVRLYKAGKKGPYCWAAMEYIEGENLSQLIKRIGIEDMLDWKEVWRVAIDIARALDTGHKNKIIHRNVTPTNILRRKSDGACLLGDLMLAKALEGKLAIDVTSAGQILGDILYLSPERALGGSEVDTRSDLYGLGAACYALLTGRPPVSGTSTTDMVKNIRDEVPKAPKSFQLSVNDLFQDVIMTLLQKDPADRIQTPAKLIKELLRIGKYNNLDAGF
jgi:serine/threonine protein kinase